MAATGLTRTLEESFAAGMYRAGRSSEIPAGGAFDISNGLLDRSGGIYKRGGTAYRASAFGTAGLRFVWDGWLAAGQTTLVASPSAFGKVAAGAVSALGGAGLSVAARPAVYEGKIYLPGGFVYDGTTVTAAAKTSAFYAVVSNRLLAIEGSKVLFSKIGKPAEWEGTDFHQLPGGVEVLGLEGLRSSAAVFTTQGVWLIGGLAKNLTDASGNVQQTLDLYSADFILWGAGGVANWQGALVVPSIDGVYLLELGVTSEKLAPFQRISDPIVDLYQEYVREGYQPGQACVFRNHYLLPIIGGGDVRDVLVCRLDMPAARGSARPWTHLEGSGSKCAAFAQRVSAGSSRSPELLGALYGAVSRPITCSYLEPSANTELDHDGGVPNFSLTTRSYAVAGAVPGLVAKLRLRYQLVGPASPMIQAQAAAESPLPPAGTSTWGNFAWGVGKWAAAGLRVYETLVGLAPPDPAGAKPYVWHPRRKRRFMQLRFTCGSRTSTLTIRAIELFVRVAGRG